MSHHRRNQSVHTKIRNTYLPRESTLSPTNDDYSSFYANSTYKPKMFPSHHYQNYTNQSHRNAASQTNNTKSTYSSTSNSSNTRYSLSNASRDSYNWPTKDYIIYAKKTKKSSGFKPGDEIFFNSLYVENKGNFLGYSDKKIVIIDSKGDIYKINSYDIV